jgi:hypothetical protein
VHGWQRAQLQATREAVHQHLVVAHDRVLVGQDTKWNLKRPL